jgi:transposase
MGKIPRRYFSLEEQAEVVRLVVESGRPTKHVAAELGISDRTVWQWVNNARLEGIDPAGELTREQRNRIRDLEKKVALLERDLAFEKKAVAFFKELDRDAKDSQ